MTEEQYAQLCKLQQVGLTMDDLRIYLDTHPSDAFAIERFNMAAQENHQLLAAYGAAYGPLTGLCPQQQGADAGWLWANSDFPWQY